MDFIKTDIAVILNFYKNQGIVVCNIILIRYW